MNSKLSILEKKKSLNESLLKCENIIRFILEDYISILEKFHTDLDSKVSIKENIDLKRQIYFLNYVLVNLSIKKINLRKIYEPAKLEQHAINGIITFIILLAIYFGVILANDNFLKKRKK